MITNLSFGQTTRIIGNLNGLPDGEIFLVKSGSGVKDSSHTIRGKFDFELNFRDTLNLYFLEHYDLKGNKTLLYFKSKTKGPGGFTAGTFFLDKDTIRIKGKVKKFHSRNLKMPEHTRVRRVNSPVKGGNQTSVIYNLDFNFYKPVTEHSFRQLSKTIARYPYSVYLLKELNAHRSAYSAFQLEELFSGFDTGVIRSALEGDNIGSSIKNKENSSKYIAEITLKNVNNRFEKLIDGQANVNMIILWASWCVPCLAEIPDLKKVFEKYKNDKRVHMVSVSIDAAEIKWRMALGQFNMAWQQLWLPSELKQTFFDVFELDGNIPVILFTNGKGEILKKITGRSKAKTKEYKSFLESRRGMKN